MARKVTISREVILEAALKILIRDGYAAVNVKTIASEIGCSTQPIVWHFENMDGVRTALSEYAREYAAKKAFLDSQNKAYIGRLRAFHQLFFRSGHDILDHPAPAQFFYKILHDESFTCQNAKVRFFCLFLCLSTFDSE